ncbi:MAG: hypothetical protein A3A16_02110 [Candidatus Harrisonbacteria bacterium RIFCSPLOWO2_01_FULL_44_18]|uniref:Uncharacterized protein n=1 Tax=Candidatus Harrisonbacteria bacterium RIFCSPLOWO2_01_FULL_44_18 TaxID=1798407 RepID=A0A1G1ZME6_9BACT|nr:MAG: hypothetical protein A3A16_02110 [Candidatus Harrisonbacteria bacterium RIFCSPLOWO2_01_FULL_44_18]
MRNMEKELKIEKSLEEKLRERGYQIERAQLSEDESRQCDKCMDRGTNFQFYREGWFIEGSFYCSNHKEGATKILEEIDKDVERRKLEQERIIEERRKQSGLR